MKKMLFVFTCSMLIGIVTMGQNVVICKELQSKYNRSVATKVYSLIKFNNRSVPCSEQMGIAQRIVQNDSLIISLVNAGISTDSIENVEKKFDSALQLYSFIKESALENKRILDTKYFSEQLNIINSIKPLNKVVADSLKRKFIEINNKMLTLDVENRFNQAFKQVVFDTIYYNKFFQQSIFFTAALLQRSELEYLRQYKVSPGFYKTVVPLVIERANKLALVNYANVFNRKGDSITHKATAYYDSLRYIMLLKDGALISSSLIHAAVRMRNSLQLRVTQVDSLIERGMNLNRLKDSAWAINNLASYDSKDYENLWLSKVLEPEQFAILLNTKHKDAATLNAENDWLDLEKRGLTKGLDKKMTLISLMAYYMNLKSATSMYAYDIAKQDLYMKSVKEKMPHALKLLQYARKNNITNNDPETQLKVTW